MSHLPPRGRRDRAPDALVTRRRPDRKYQKPSKRQHKRQWRLRSLPDAGVLRVLIQEGEDHAVPTEEPDGR